MVFWGKVSAIVVLFTALSGAWGALRAAEGKANAVAIEAAPQPLQHECDRLAAPVDHSANFPGVEFLKIEVDAAVAACTAATQERPDEVRFVYQLGRAHDADRRYDQARALYAAAGGSRPRKT